VPETTRLEALVERIRTADTLEGLQGLTERIRASYDVDHVIYHSVNSVGEQYAALTYDPAWVGRYIEQQYARIDPVVLGALQRFHPVDWKRLDWSGPVRQAFLHEALEAGVGNQGYSVPIRGPSGQFALFTINKRTDDARWARYTGEHLSDFLLLSHYVHQRAEDISQTGARKSLPELSARETDALTLLGLGLGRGQVADRLRISEHTLRVYIDSARSKLGALNTTHAVAIAMARGVILA
jgi:DNA-binding CsgD family transcriptional regulator